MISNENELNYKVVDLVFIQLDLKMLLILLCRTMVINVVS